MKRFIMVILVGFCIISGNVVWAQNDKATAEGVYDLVLKGHSVLSNLGEAGLVAFNDPKGEFVYKDTYAFVMQCPEYVVAHPFALDKLKGKDLTKIYPFQNTLCEGAKNSNGTWVEYQWPKPGETKPSRKIAFIIKVDGTPYSVAASIYSDTLSVDELNAKVNK